MMIAPFFVSLSPPTIDYLTYLYPPSSFFFPPQACSSSEEIPNCTFAGPNSGGKMPTLVPLLALRFRSRLGFADISPHHAPPSLVPPALWCLLRIPPLFFSPFFFLVFFSCLFLLDSPLTICPLPLPLLRIPGCLFSCTDHDWFFYFPHPHWFFFKFTKAIHFQVFF